MKLDHHQARAYRYLFGPLPSRRFGRSLGVDVVPRKTCGFDCVFCEAGRTSIKTLERKEYAPVDAVLAELDAWMEDGGTADYITLCGAGEPTLHSRFGDVLAAIRDRCSIKTALLTNSSLLCLADVRAAACKADVVKASLSAWDEDSFRALNRPHSDLGFERVLDGLQRFSAEFGGKLWIEVFVLGGFNDRAESMRKIADLTGKLRPDRIHLNTVARPPAEPTAKPADMDALLKFAPFFTPRAEIIAQPARSSAAHGKVSVQDVLALLQRRMSTSRDIAEIFGVSTGIANGIIEELTKRGEVGVEQRGESACYSARVSRQQGEGVSG